MPSRIYSRSQHDLYWLNVVFAHLLFPLKRTNTGWEPTLSLSLLTVLLYLQYGTFISHCRCILMMYADSWARPTIVSRSGYKYTEPWFRQSKCNSYIAYSWYFTNLSKSSNAKSASALNPFSSLSVVQQGKALPSIAFFYLTVISPLKAKFLFYHQKLFLDTSQIFLLKSTLL